MREVPRFLTIREKPRAVGHDCVAASITEYTHCEGSGNSQLPAAFVEPESCDMHHPRLLHRGYPRRSARTISKIITGRSHTER